MEFPGQQREYNGQSWKKVIRKAGRFSGLELDGCTFTRCNFSESIFEECAFRGCLFKDCDLSRIKVPGSSFAEVRFENCQLVGVNWAESALADKKLVFGKPFDFSGCLLNQSIFMWLTLKEIQLTGCTCIEADFSEADLTGADCTRTDFANTRFWHTNLSGADFSGASNYTIPASLNTLKKTKFSLPEAMALLYSLDIILSEES